MTVRTCERVALTRIVVVEGRGFDGDPIREVTYWYDDDGKQIAHEDPHTREDFDIAKSPGLGFSTPSVAGAAARY